MNHHYPVILIALITLLLLPVSQAGLSNLPKIDVDTSDNDFWGVIIGISDYKDKQNDLPVSTVHLKTLYNTLLESENWKSDHIRLLINEEATYMNILHALDWLANQSDENDTILFSFQGHGSSIEDDNDDEIDGYDEGIVAWEGLSGLIIDDILDSKFDNISCKGMFLIFHSCLSGGLIDSPQQSYRFSINLQQDLSDDYRVIVVSSQDQGLALAFPSLTRQLAFGLKGAADEDSSSTGYNIISAEEAATFAKNQVNKIFLLLFIIFPPAIISVILSEFISKILHGYWILPFPMIYDSYPDELPIFFR